MRKLILVTVFGLLASFASAADAPTITTTVGGEFSGLRNTKKSYHLTTNVTNTSVAQTATLYGITINCSTAGTAWTITIRDKSGTPQNVINALTFATSQNPLTIQIPLPGIVMNGGIDIITAGTTPGVADLFISYK